MKRLLLLFAAVGMVACAEKPCVRHEAELFRLREENAQLRFDLERTKEELEVVAAAMCMLYDSLERRDDPSYKPAVDSKLFFVDKAEYRRQLDALKAPTREEE
jgi:hypothetical protein